MSNKNVSLGSTKDCFVEEQNLRRYLRSFSLGKLSKFQCIFSLTLDPAVLVCHQADRVWVKETKKRSKGSSCITNFGAVERKLLQSRNEVNVPDIRDRDTDTGK